MAEKVDTYGDRKAVELLKDEAEGLIYEAGITSITFYEGKPPTEAIRAQFERVVAANPWIVGRLATLKGAVCLRHPLKPEKGDLDASFHPPETVRFPSA